MSKQKKLPGRRMTLIDTCWRRNLSVWVLVCMCWFGSVAGQKALEQVEDESNEAASEEATTSLTNDTASLGKEPLETLELEQPDKTSGISRCKHIVSNCPMSHVFGLFTFAYNLIRD